MYVYFCFGFFTWYSNRKYEFWNSIKRIFAGTKVIKTYSSTIKKKRKKNDKIVLLEKRKLKSIELILSQALIDSCIRHNKFVLMINVLVHISIRKKKLRL